MLSQSQIRSYWSPRCTGPHATVSLYGAGKVTVDAAIVSAVKALDQVLTAYKYSTRAADTGAYVCRMNTGGTAWSNHAYGIAMDINWGCLSGDTLVTTFDGPVSLEELSGTTARILTRDPLKGRQAMWVDAPIRQFGEQETFVVRVSRRGIDKQVRATGNHRWFVRRKENRNQAKTKQVICEVFTSDLRSGDAIVGCLPPPQAFRTKLSAVGVAAGNVYGDGSRESNRGSVVDLYGPAMELLRFYAEPRVFSVRTANGVPGLRVTHLPGAWKDLPNQEESSAYLMGWLAGYFAADGCVSSNGHASICSNDLESLETFSVIASKVGIACGPIRSEKHEAFGGVYEKFTMSLIPSSVPEHFFVRSDHRERFAPVVRKTDRYDFTVESVELYGVEPVYCATVEPTGTFTLDGWVLTGNSNPYSQYLKTDMRRYGDGKMPERICAIRTNNGKQVWNWGGFWSGNKDAMHYEIVCTPSDIRTGINQSTIYGGSVAQAPNPAPTPQPGPQPVPQPKEDDEMLIIKAPGKPTRLLAPPLFVILDNQSMNALILGGVKVVAVTKVVYDAMRDQVIRALDET